MVGSMRYDLYVIRDVAEMERAVALAQHLTERAAVAAAGGSAEIAKNLRDAAERARADGFRHRVYLGHAASHEPAWGKA